MFEKVEKLRLLLLSFEKIIAASSLLILLTLTLAQVIARDFFETGINHIDVISRHLVLFILFMGAAIISEQNKHIKIDILAALLSDKNKQRLQTPLFLLSSLICFILAYYAILFWQDEYIYAPRNEQLAVYLALIIPIGFFILASHLLLLSLSIQTHKTLVSEHKK